MSSFPNPVHSILQGLLTGYSVASQIRRAALEEEIARRNMERQDFEDQLRDIEARLRLSQVGRPVLAGTVMEPGPEGGAPLVRPARKGTIKYKSRSGEELEVEPYTPEELSRMKVQSEVALEAAKKQAATEAEYASRAKALDVFGVPIGEDLARETGLPPNTKVFPNQLPSVASAAARIFQARQKVKTDDQDPVHQAYVTTNDRGDVTVIKVHKSGKMSTEALKGAGKTSQGDLSPTEQRLRQKEAKQDRANQIAGKILSETGFDLSRALSYLRNYFLDHPEDQPYQMDVWRILTSRVPGSALDTQNNEMILRMLTGQGSASGLSPEAEEYLKKKGIQSGRQGK
jgi:hypothetical protein